MLRTSPFPGSRRASPLANYHFDLPNLLMATPVSASRVVPSQGFFHFSFFHSYWWKSCRTVLIFASLRSKPEPQVEAE